MRAKSLSSEAMMLHGPGSVEVRSTMLGDLAAALLKLANGENVTRTVVP